MYSKISILIFDGVEILDFHEREATTHHSAFDELQALAPTARSCPSKRFVDTGDIITAAGISAGIDAALDTVAKISSPQVAEKTAAEMEYDWP